MDEKFLQVGKWDFVKIKQTPGKWWKIIRVREIVPSAEPDKKILWILGRDRAGHYKYFSNNHITEQRKRGEVTP